MTEKAYTPEPLEYMHGQIMELFHKYRTAIHDDLITIPFNGGILNELITEAKRDTKEKFNVKEL